MRECLLLLPSLAADAFLFPAGLAESSALHDSPPGAFPPAAIPWLGEKPTWPGVELKLSPREVASEDALTTSQTFNYFWSRSRRDSLPEGSSLQFCSNFELPVTEFFEACAPGDS